MKTIELKCWPEFYEAVESGAKPFEVRKNDRGYQVGDLLVLRRFDSATQSYTGAQLSKTITYILPLENVPGVAIEKGIVILGLSRCECLVDGDAWRVGR